MPTGLRLFVCAWLALFAGGASAQASKPPTLTEGRVPFVVFDALSYDDKPNLRRLGLIELRGSEHIVRPGLSREDVDPPGVVSIAKYLATLSDPYYLDVEWWNVYDAPPDVIRANVAKLIRVADIARSATPDRRLGFYGLLPNHTYWPFILERQNEIDEWHRSNELTAPLAAHVDYLFPSLYTFYEDREGWKTAARAMLIEARRYGKPVYPFLWPAYHNSNKQLALQPIPPDYWRMELELVREYADGVVLWGGYKEKWDENAPWWRETKAFLATLRKVSE